METAQRHNRAIRLLTVGLIALFCNILSVAQPVSTAPVQGDTVISVVNFYPGAEIFELEGHTALRVQVPGGDFGVSYGMFSFNEPNFVYRFVKGETDYWVGLVPWEPFVDSYTRQGRRVVEHVIAMSPEQKKRMLELLQENLLPQNAVYRYNYVRDNCATRPLAIVEKALGDSIVLGEPALTPGDRDTAYAAAVLAAPVSWRDAMRHYHARYPWYQFGIDICLGSGIDFELDNRQKAFAPVILDSQLANATVAGRPLVAQTTVVNDVPADNGILSATPWFLTPMCVFTLWFVLVCIVTVHDIRRHSVSRWLDSLLFGLYGTVGLLVAFLVFVSEHEATSPNWLIWWLNPLCFVPALLVWIKSARKLLICFQIANFAVLTMLACAWAATGQSANPAFLPLFAAEMVRTLSYIYINKTNRDKFLEKGQTK